MCGRYRLSSASQQPRNTFEPPSANKFLAVLSRWNWWAFTEIQDPDGLVRLARGGMSTLNRKVRRSIW